MFFTQEDYRKIEKWLLANSRKDTDFVGAATPLKGNETVVLVQNGKNVKTSVKDIVDQFFLLGVSDFLNITDKYGESYISLTQAIQLIPFRSRKEGQVITFIDESGNWAIYQFQGKALNQWNNTTLWIDLLAKVSGIPIIDSEDITTKENGAKQVSLYLADKQYNEADYSGLGRIYLRKNIQTIIDPSTGKVINVNLLTQSMLAKENTIYILQYDYNLNNQTITIPEGCILDMRGGSITNGTINCVDTIIISTDASKLDVTLTGTYRFDSEKLVTSNTEDINISQSVDRKSHTISAMLADRDTTNGMGYVILRKNKSFKEQVTQENTIYEIRYDFDLDSEIINIQQNCSLKFCGGNLKNGTIVGDNTVLINFEDKLRDVYSVKYDGSFICRQNFIYETIADARKHVNFPGKIVSTIGYTFANDNGGCRYKVVTVEQASAANSFFKGYWLYTDVAAKTGMFVPIEDERLWLMYADSKTEVNLSIFGIVYDANYYNINDKLWYSDEEFETLATDNHKNFKAAIGQTKWWSLKMIPSVYILSNTIVINSPLLLEHGSHSFILKGTGFQEGIITTNEEIEALIYNIYGSTSDITNLTGTFYHLDNIVFNGNYKATDCLVVKNGYEADSIEHCGFHSAKDSGIRMWGVSSTFKVNNITAFDNGLYGVSICSTWTHNGEEYTQNMEGQLSLFEISGDNNKALIGIDVKGDGASINLQNLKCEDRSTDKTDHCTIHIKNISTATGVNIMGAFSNTETPFIIIDSSSLNTPCLRLNNIFNNCSSDTKSLIIDDRKNNKKVYNHSKGNSCVSLIYRDGYSSDTFKTGLSQYSNGEYNGGVINDVNFKTKNSLEEFNTAFSDYRKGYSNLATIADNDGGIIFSDINSDWIDVFGNILYNTYSVDITCNGDNYNYTIDLANFSRNTLFKITVESINFTGKIKFYASNNSIPDRTINSLNVAAGSKTSFYSSIRIPRYLLLNFKESKDGDTIKLSILSSVNLPLAITDIDNRAHYSMLSGGIELPIIDSTYQGKTFVKGKDKYIANSEGKWVLESKGVEYNKYGDTSNRPQLDSSMEGFTYYESTLKKMILWNGTAWVNMDGTALI